MKYQYIGDTHTMLRIKKNEPKVRVEPKEVVETDLVITSRLFKKYQEPAKTKKSK